MDQCNFLTKSPSENMSRLCFNMGLRKKNICFNSSFKEGVHEKLFHCLGDYHHNDQLAGVVLHCFLETKISQYLRSKVIGSLKKSGWRAFKRSSSRSEVSCVS